jgi:hypothetical protein
MFAKYESCSLIECFLISEILTNCHLFLVLLVGQVMSSSVDSGASYWDSDSSKEIFEQSGGLTSATVVHTFAPHRETRFWGKLGKSASLESVFRTTLNPLDLSLTARKHSEYGAGIQIKQFYMFSFQIKRITNGQSRELSFQQGHSC